MVHGQLKRGQPGPLTISPAGREALDQAWPAVMAVNGPVAMGLRAHEADHLRQLLEKLRQQLMEKFDR